MTVELSPCTRFEWERIVRRVTLPKPVKLAALVLSTYADPDGTNIRPGAHRLAAVTGDSERNARRMVATLADHGLIDQTRRGGGRSNPGIAAVYRLTIPDDILDRPGLLDPDETPCG